MVVLADVVGAARWRSCWCQASSITELIGFTPVVRLNRIVPPGSATVWVKLESANPGGSVKDRIAIAMVNNKQTKIVYL